MSKITIYDTTLRDGEQAEEIAFSVEDKLLVTRKLDELGVRYIEGGYPGANPRDAEFFSKATKIHLDNAVLTAFSATHKPGTSPEKDSGINAILDSGVSVATIFGKTWDFHVKLALKVTNRENLSLIYDTVHFLKRRMEKVFFDAEHFFDGYIKNPEYAIKCLKAATDAGADCLVLCDTNGGTMPDLVREITAKVKKATSNQLGIHAHNDSECAVASSLMAVKAGARHVQGTINGLGERTGNANLCSIIPNLQIKLGHKCISNEQMSNLRNVSRFVNELANIMHFARQPYVGDSAFAHKAGMHVSALLKASETYEHIPPATVGNTQRVLVSDLAGKGNVLRKAKDLGIKIDPKSPKLAKVVSKLKELEGQGFQFESAEASFELMMKRTLGLGKKWKFFELEGFRVLISKRREGEPALHESTVRIKTPDGQSRHTVGDGNGPVNALDNALRKALIDFYPELKEVKLLDYKVRVLTPGKGTGANVRVLIESGDGTDKWCTVGVSEDVVEASYQALVDSIEYKLIKERGK